MLAAFIVFPAFILAGVLFMYLPLEYSWVSVIFLSIGVGAFIVRRGIDEWWYSRNPPGLADKEKEILNKHFAYYRQLNKANKEEFERRVSVFRIQKMFQMRGADKLPGDVQLLVCAAGIQTTMGFPTQREFYKKLSTIVLFPRTFITPEINTQLHAIEVNHGKPYDCMLLAINVYIDSLLRPKSFYNPALYGFAKAFRLEKNVEVDKIPYDDYKETLARLHVMRGYEIGYIFSYTGLKDFELFELLVEHFFVFPDQLQQHLPKVYNYLMNLFKQDPCNKANPVIQENVVVME